MVSLRHLLGVILTNRNSLLYHYFVINHKYNLYIIRRSQHHNININLIKFRIHSKCFLREKLRPQMQCYQLKM